MSFYVLRFNLYLLLGALVLAGGCHTSKSEKSTKKPTNLCTLRVHMEDRAQLPDSGTTVEVLRSSPVKVSIAMEPFLTEDNVIKATLLETPGGYAIEVKLNNPGTWSLEQFTAANPGRHLAIFCQWGTKKADSRWLAAPIVPRRLATGVLAFTPDCSREEAEKIVAGLNNMAKKLNKGKM